MASGILYPLFRPFAKVTIRIYFRKLHIKGREKIPMDGPLIIASNHPNSFAEPIIYATNLRRQLHFLVRGDVFENPIAAWILRQTNQIPIYRIRDGFKSLKRNNETFEACYSKLNEKEALVIFSEGLCVMEKRLRPLKKGTARIALGTIETKGPQDDFMILPVGVNYTHGDRYRREVMVNFGDPIKVSDYWKWYQNDPGEAISKMTAQIEEAIRPLVIEVKKKDREWLYNSLMDIVNSQIPYKALPVIENSDDRFQREMCLAEIINSWSEEETIAMTEKVEALKKLYLKGLEHYQLKNIDGPDKLAWLWVFPLSVIGLPGVLLHLLPFLLSIYLASWFKQTIEFYTPVRMVGLMIFSLLLYLSMIILGLVIEQYWLVLIALIGPGLGKIAAIYAEKVSSILIYFKWKFSVNRSTVKEYQSSIIKDLGL